MAENHLFYGDNLDVLRKDIEDESVDLVYLDPPFKSDQNYNILFAAKDGTDSAAQIQAFEDTWKWDEVAAQQYHETVTAGGPVSDALQGFRKLIDTSDMLAYLTMMAPRLVELRRKLKPTGSLYLHCDPVASHYLKLLLDAVFGPEHFRNEIIWRRTGAHGKVHRYGPIHDVILYYVASDEAKWNDPTRPYMRGHVEEYFVKDAKGYRTDYYGNVLTGSGLRGGESGKPWQGFDPSAKGRHWAIPGALVEDLGEDLSEMTQHEKLDRLYEMGFIKIVPGQAWPIYERYLKPGDGMPVPDIWAFQPYTGGTVFGTDEGIDEDVRWLSTRDAERLGYPTQKPVALLERIIKASSDVGDLVLDPFCGCGTTVAAAQKLDRRWIGIDITYLAIALIRRRLRDAYGAAIDQEYDVLGRPTTAQDAEELAKTDEYQFQWWVLDLIGARGSQKKGADKGVDGRIVFRYGPTDPTTKEIIISVKAGKLHAHYIRDLVGVVAREKAEIGVLISFDKPTDKMREEAASHGYFDSPWGSHPRIQLRTVAELLEGKGIDQPQVQGVNQTFRVAERVVRKDAVALPLSGDMAPGKDHVPGRKQGKQSKPKKQRKH